MRPSHLLFGSQRAWQLPRSVQLNVCVTGASPVATLVVVRRHGGRVAARYGSLPHRLLAALAGHKTGATNGA
jgi:hypothetical protein